MRPRLLAVLALLTAFAGLAPVIGRAAPAAAVLVPAAVPDSPTPGITLNRIGRYAPGPYRDEDPRAAEIVAFDPITDRMFIVNSFTRSVDIVSLANPAAPALVSTIPISPTYGAAPNSVAVFDGVVAVAVEANPKTSPGRAAFFTASGVFLNQVTVGAQPDMITFTPDGRRVLTANEGEPNSYGQVGSIDPEGSVSIIAMPTAGTRTLTTTTTLGVTTVGFGAFNVGQPRNSELSPNVRIFGPGASVAQDLEPEYIAVSSDSNTAYVSLQENNALAIINIPAGTVTSIVPLGFKNHNLPGNGMDPSDQDGVNSIRTVPVLGMYQPDGIGAYTSGGATYVVTANEGDARDYPGYTEEIRAGNSAYVLDTAVFTNAATLKQNANLGRLTVTRATGDPDNDGNYEAIYSFGARSFSIRDGATGALIFDSGDDMEQRTAALYPNNFNSSHTNSTRDNRSDDKGPEPEDVELGRIGGRVYAFIGLERMGGVIVYDVTNPVAPTFVHYVNPRTFPGTFATGTPDDLGPEGITFVPAADSPNNRPLLLVANEVSGSVSVYAVEGGQTNLYLPVVTQE